ncbi:MAG: hypothetical protein DRP71_01770 [Verrucomicrobia bacterium]|nr:MAG: hypothetical protein DRP71_01770 [Verrucomicrobiota bacterium]
MKASSKYFRKYSPLGEYGIVTTAFLAILSFGLTPDLSGAVIRGQVIDSDLVINLEGVRIEVEGTDISVFSERGGKFVLRGVSAGKHVLKATYVGYPETTETVTLGEESKSFYVVIDLNTEETVELEAFVVEGSQIGRAKAINLQRSADNVTNVISSDAIGQFVDRNAAEALQRLPGIAVEDSQGEGKYIVIRGADPSLNAVTIDGVTLATPDEDGRSTGLNIISTDQLERIEVVKSWLPDKSANNVGGTVNMVTRSALDRGERFASVEAAYTQHTIADDPSYRVNATYGDVFGKEKNIGFQISYNQSEDSRGSDTLRADDWQTLGEAPLRGLPTGFFMGGIQMEDYNITRERSAIGGKLEFRLADRHQFHVSASFNQFDDDEVLQETRFNVNRGGTFYPRNVIFTEAVALALGYNPEDPEVAARINGTAPSRKDIFFDEAVQLGDIAWDPVTHNFTLIGGNSRGYKTWQNTVTADEILTYNIGGEHRLSDWIDLDYKYFVSEAEKIWTERRVTLDSNTLAGEVALGNEDYFPQAVEDTDRDILLEPESYLLNRNRGRAADNAFFSTDKRNGFEVNLEGNYNIGDFSASTKIGGHFDFREKEFFRDFNRFSSIDTAPLPQLTLADSVFGGGTMEADFLSNRSDYKFGPIFDTGATNAFLDDPGDVELIQTPDDITFNVTDAILKNYLADEDVLAGYLMQTFEKGSFKIIAGVRFEETRNTFTNTEILTRPEEGPPFVSPAFWKRLPLEVFSQQVASEKSYSHVLPAFHLRKEFGEKTLVRASYTETIARPKFTDLVPREIVAVSGAAFGSSVQLPNFELAPMESTNIDLAFEHYLESLGLFSVSGFYKKLEGPIYTESRVVEPGTGVAPQLAAKYDSRGRDSTPWETTQKMNAGDGELYGVEIAFDRKLTFLPEPFDGFGFAFNAAFIQSNVQLLLEERFEEEVPLFKQSSNMGNLSVFYEKFGLLVRLAMNWRGGYLDGIRAGQTDIDDMTLETRHNLTADSLDVYVDDFRKLDLTIQYRFMNHFMVFFEATNLTDEPLRRYRGDTSRLHSIQYTGTIYSLGAKWTL